MKKRLLISLAMAFVLVAAIVVNGAAAKNSNEVIIALNQEPDSLNWLISDMSATSQVTYAITKDLIVTDDKWFERPDMLTQIPTVENGLWKVLPDGKMEITFKLKKGIKWSDGKEVTAEDFKFTWETEHNKDLSMPSTEAAERIKDMKILDKYTFVAYYNEKYHLAYTGLDYQVLPKHICAPILKESAKAFMESDFRSKPVGNGPYMVKEWVPGSHILLVPNPNYNLGPKAKIARIIYKFIPNNNTMMANMLAGSIDLVLPLGTSYDWGDNLEQMIKQQNKTDVKVVYTPALVWEHIDLNLDDPLFKDKRVRQALLYSIDRQAIVNALFKGKQQVADSYLPPKHYGYNAKVAKYAFDPKKAADLFAAAGWKKGSDGILTNDKGQKYIVTINTTAGNATREKVEQIIKAQWKETGVELKIENQPAAVLFGETTTYRKFQMALYAWVNGPTSTPTSLWHSKRVPTEENGWSGQNYPGWRNAKADALCDKVEEELNKPQRIKLMQEHQAMWADEIPSIPLYFRVDVSAQNTALKGYLPTGSTIGGTWNVNKWSWVK